MEIQKFNDPWPHYIIDNFLSQEDFLQIEEIIEDWDWLHEYIPSAYWDIRKNYSIPLNYISAGRVFKQGDFEKEIEERGVPMKLERTSFPNSEQLEVASILTKYIQPLEDEFKLKGKYAQCNLMYSDCRDYQNYDIHCDPAHKALSCVLYFSPKKSMGTHLYRMVAGGRMRKVKTIEWKPNRMFIFKQQQKVTWHNYSTNTERRITFNYNFSKAPRQLLI